MTTLHKAVKVIADSVEKLAFEMPAPNPYTPRFVILVIALREALAQQVEPVAWVDMADGVPTEQPRLWQEHSHDEVPLYAGAAPAAQPTCKQDLQVPTVKESLRVATGWVAPKDRYAVPVLFNPYTGEPRDVRDVQSDPQGVLIVPPGKVEILAAKGADK